jgi:hypothetical protein
MEFPLRIKTSWPLLKNAFVHQFGGGDVPARTALLELKAISQGKTPIAEFGPKLTMLMEKAEIVADHLQLDILYQKMRPDLKEN